MTESTIYDVLTGNAVMRLVKVDQNVWEVYHYGTLPNGRYALRHRFVDLLSYNIRTDYFCADYLEPYGFDSLEDFQRVYGKERWRSHLAQKIFLTELVYAEIICTGTHAFCARVLENRTRDNYSVK